MSHPVPQSTVSQDLFGHTDPADDPDRLAWRQLVGQTLPDLAAERGWPIHLDHCFARVLLDNTVGKPWREQIPAPAWRNMPPQTLKAALALGDDIVNGTQDLAALNARSLALRGKANPQRHDTPHS